MFLPHGINSCDIIDTTDVRGWSCSCALYVDHMLWIIGIIIVVFVGVVVYSFVCFCLIFQVKLIYDFIVTSLELIKYCC